MQVSGHLKLAKTSAELSRQLDELVCTPPRWQLQSNQVHAGPGAFYSGCFGVLLYSDGD